MIFGTSDVSKFLRSTEPIFRRRLLNELGPARVVSLIQFERFLEGWQKPIESVAIVSGSLSEPELNLIRGQKKVTLFNFEADPVLFDLNKDWSSAEWTKHHNAFDLVLCEQVLEHLIDPKQAVQNLSQLLKPGGLLHVTVPAINNSHGEPFFFYAGFPTATLEAFAKHAGLTVRECGSWMSDKASRMYATCDWSPLSHSGTISHMIQGLWLGRNNLQDLINILYGRFRNFAAYPLQKLFDAKSRNNAVETWLFAAKPERLGESTRQTVDGL
jgi:SAM-dependent methyltransferase